MLVPAPVVVPFVEDGLRTGESPLVQHLTNDAHILYDARRFAVVHMVREEVQRDVFLLHIVKEIGSVLARIGESRSADFQIREALFQVPGSRLIQFVELLHGTAPGARIRFPAVTRLVQVGFVPDFPVLDSHMVSVGPALVVMADNVFAYPGPLLIILRRVYAVFLLLMLDALAQAEERLSAGFKHILQDNVAHRKVVGLGRVDIGVEVGEYLVDVDTVAAVFGSQRGVVRAGIRNPKILVFRHRHFRGAVVRGIHRFHRTQDGGRIDLDHRLGVQRHAAAKQHEQKRYESFSFHHF